MSATTGIEWTDATWNPIRGCSRVSEGCRNCYAEKVAYRFSGPDQAYEGLVRINAAGERRPEWNGQVRFVKDHLFDPLKWKQPRRIFVNSMSDLFHEGVSNQEIVDILGIAMLAYWHDFQILTKRPERAYDLLHSDDHGIGAQFRALAGGGGIAPGVVFKAIDRAKRDKPEGWMTWPPRNIRIGFSAENQETYDERVVPIAALSTAGWGTMASLEPLLGPIDLRPKADTVYQLLSQWYSKEGFDPTGSQPQRERMEGCIPKIDWVIVGGESGPDSRPCNTGWISPLVQQCANAGVACFVKQLGSHVIQGGERRTKRDKKGADMHEWPHEIRVQQFPAVHP